MTHECGEGFKGQEPRRPFCHSINDSPTRVVWNFRKMRVCLFRLIHATYAGSFFSLCPFDFAFLLLLYFFGKMMRRVAGLHTKHERGQTHSRDVVVHRWIKPMRHSCIRYVQRIFAGHADRGEFVLSTDFPFLPRCLCYSPLSPSPASFFFLLLLPRTLPPPFCIILDPLFLILYSPAYSRQADVCLHTDNGTRARIKAQYAFQTGFFTSAMSNIILQGLFSKRKLSNRYKQRRCARFLLVPEGSNGIRCNF